MPLSDGRPEPIFRQLWSLRDDTLVEADDDWVTVVTQWGETRIDDATPVVREALRRMTLGPVSLHNVLPAGTAGAGDEWERLHKVLDRLGGAVVHSLGPDDDSRGPVLSVVPVTREAVFRPRPLVPGALFRLSRFSSIRSDGGELVVESPLTHHRVVLHWWLASAVITELGSAGSIAAVADAVCWAPLAVGDLVRHLVAAGVVVVAEPAPDGGSVFGEDTDSSLSSWSPIDLLFHTRSRTEVRDERSSPVAVPPLASVRYRPDGPRRRLYAPDVLAMATADPTLTEVLESDEVTDLVPLSAERLGELLFRAARVRTFRVTPWDAGSELAVSELELYVSVDSCAGLDRGIYHYVADEHSLVWINGPGQELEEVLGLARIAVGTVERPTAVITVTARVDRLAWAHGGIAYATALQHLGMLQQTMRLVGTAMRLGPRAVVGYGGGPVGRALRLYWPAEVPIGELVLGFRR